MGQQLIATVAEGNRTRVYVDPTPEHEAAARIARPLDVPDQELGYHPKDIWTPPYGLTRFADLFTARQLTALTTFGDLVAEARQHILVDALATGMPEGERLEAGGVGAAAYADAVATYLGFTISKATARNNAMCTWEAGMDRLRGAFQRQAIPMTWEYAEANPLESFGGGLRWRPRSGVKAWTWIPLICDLLFYAMAAESVGATPVSV